MALGVDYTSGCGYINAAGNGDLQPVCLQTRGGKVGIGTTTPTATLDVVGSAKISGTLSAGRPPTWFITSGTAQIGNAYTPAGKILGSTDNVPSTTGFNSVTTYGGATSGDWNTTTATFTASASGLYYFQLHCFVNTYVSGRWLRAAGTGITDTVTSGGFQYLMFDISFSATYGASEGMFTVSVMYYISSGKTFAYACEAASPQLYYGTGHTTLQIIKLL
jgi:hypothetical protein